MLPTGEVYFIQMTRKMDETMVKWVEAGMPSSTCGCGCETASHSMYGDCSTSGCHTVLAESADCQIDRVAKVLATQQGYLGSPSSSWTQVGQSVRDTYFIFAKEMIVALHNFTDKKHVVFSMGYAESIRNKRSA